MAADPRWRHGPEGEDHPSEIGRLRIGPHVCFVAMGFLLAMVGLLLYGGISHATYPGANGRISFARSSSIGLMDPDGTNVSSLTNQPASYGPAGWSADGGTLVFTSDMDEQYNLEIYQMNADGSNLQRLTNDSATDRYPTLLPDGRIAFSSDRDGGSKVYVMDSDGSNVQIAFDDLEYGYPSWSPDGTRIAFVRDSNIYVMGTDGTGTQELTHEDPFVGGIAFPEWSPDSSTILFTSYRDGNFEVYSMDADGSNQTNLTNSTSDDENAVWSPDGAQIAFQSDRDDPNNDIYVMNSDGSSVQRLTTGGSNFAPRWQPILGGTSIPSDSPSPIADTIVQVSPLSATLPKGSSLVMTVEVNTERTVAGWTVVVQYDPSVLVPQYCNAPITNTYCGPVNVDNGAGMIFFGGPRDTSPGDVALGTIAFGALGSPGESSPISLLIQNLNESSGGAIPAATDVSTVTITPSQVQPTPVQPEWLAYLNQYRAQSGLPPTVESPAWSAGCALHSRYVVINDVTGLGAHIEWSNMPGFTEQGGQCGANGNIAFTADASDAIDGWMQAPFHALGILDPHLLATGFGSDQDSSGAVTAASTLDVIRGRNLPDQYANYPVFFPGNGATVNVLQHWGEVPSPLTSCPGYSAPSGLPIILQVEESAGAPSVGNYSLTSGADQLDVCEIDETNYTNPSADEQNLGRSILASRHAIVLIAKQPLLPSKTYTASIQVNGVDCTWSFSTSGQSAQVNADATLIAPSGAGTSCVHGDVTCDDLVNGADVAAVLREAAGVAGATGNCMASGDVDGNSILTVNDALLMLKYWAGLLPNLPRLGLTDSS